MLNPSKEEGPGEATAPAAFEYQKIIQAAPLVLAPNAAENPDVVGLVRFLQLFSQIADDVRSPNLLGGLPMGARITAALDQLGATPLGRLYKQLGELGLPETRQISIDSERAAEGGEITILSDQWRIYVNGNTLDITVSSSRNIDGLLGRL